MANQKLCHFSQIAIASKRISNISGNKALYFQIHFATFMGSGTAVIKGITK